MKTTTNYDITMDLLKAKIYLDKINREFTRMLKDPDNVPRIDVDITLSYVRELYDAFLNAETEPARTAAPAKKPAPAEATPPVVIAPPPPVVAAPPPPPPPVAPPPPVVIAPPTPPAPVPPPPPVVVAPPPPAPEPAPAPVVAHVPPPPPEPAPAPAAAAPEHRHHAANAGAAEVLFEYKEAKELSEKLSETPISDLKRSIALNDKLLLTRELFGGDNNAFDQTLTALNGFSGFEQAKSYLINNCIGTFDWLDKKKAETAKGFIRLVRRRYK